MVVAPLRLPAVVFLSRLSVELRSRGKMAATINAECVACGQVHRFYLAVADIFTVGTKYEYVCPTRARTIRMTIDRGADKAIVKSRPRGSVEVKLID